MGPEIHISQKPEPGIHLNKIQGDTIKITLRANIPMSGTWRAWVRTNIGHAAVARAEFINHINEDVPLLGRDWFDLPMQQESEHHFSIVIGLSEIGHFEAKCLLLPEHALEPLWSPGGNLVINVEPADTCCGNTLYNAFVRQFGPNKDQTIPPAPRHSISIEELDKDGYTIIPPSGTFRNLIADLDFII